nr:hypothetical protein [uncultured Rahnella sp.]
MADITATPEYNIYTARQNGDVVIILQRVSDSLAVIGPDYGYATGRIIDSYMRTIDTIVFKNLPSDITDFYYQASFSITTSN